MFGVKTLIEKLNTAINSGTLTETEMVQALSAIESLEKYFVSSVATVANLPNPIVNKGRFIWIENERRYVYSNGVSWDINNIVQKPYVNIWSWGLNTNGQLGDNTALSKNLPVSVSGNIADWVQISAASTHSVALRANGTVWAWGQGTSGNLGDNTAITKSSPVSVVGGFTDWIQIHSSNFHTLGLRTNGTAWGWGGNIGGPLGDNTVTTKSSPVSVVGGFVDWVQLSAGGRHSLGLRTNGTAWAWGNNLSGRLGDNSTVAKSSPVSVVGGFADWAQLSAGYYHSLGLRSNGTAWAWGANASGIMGDGSTTSKSSPVLVIGGFTDWTQLSAGRIHSVGLRANGTAWAWGANLAGQLGDGTVASKLSPVSVIGGFTDWVQISANGSTGINTSFTLGLRANGSVWGWGNNILGQIGYVGADTKSSPTSIAGGITDWVQVSAGNSHGLGLRA